jgi:glutathione S-transferase
MSSSSSSSFKLYYSPTSCGAANFILAHYGGLTFESEEVDVRGHKTVKGTDFYTINPKGNVPAIVLSNGKLLNENVATLTYLADKAKAAGKVTNLIPDVGTDDRYVALSVLSYLASEVHKAIGPLFMQPEAEARAKIVANLNKKYQFLNDQYLKDTPFLLGDHFTAPDSYLYLILSWNQYVGTSFDEYPKLKAFYERVKGLDFVQAAHKKMAELSAATKN